QAEDGIRDFHVTGVQTCALPILTDIVLPYAIMQTIWSFVQWLVEGKEVFNPTEPRWTLWFLLALAIFRMILPYLALLRWPLLWAVVASVGVGYFANVDSTFSLSRAIGILPFFEIGRASCRER